MRAKEWGRLESIARFHPLFGLDTSDILLGIATLIYASSVRSLTASTDILELSPVYASVMNVALCYICIDRAVDDPQIYYGIQSVRRIAKYNGPIYIVTDRGEDLMRRLKEKGEDLVDMVTPLEPIGLHATYTQMLNNRFYYRTQMRLQKTRLLEILPEHINSVVYMDADILTLGEGCIDEFIDLNVREKWADDEDLSMSCYMDTNRIVGVENVEDLGRDGRWTLHAGSFVLKRNYSEDILHRWREHSTEADSLDRLGLVRALWGKYPNTSAIDMTPTTDKSRRCDHIRPYHSQRKFLPGDHFLHPPDTIEEYLPQTCMMHVSYGRCNHLGKEYVDSILGRVLPEYNNDFCAVDPLGLGRANMPPLEVSKLSYGMLQGAAIIICIALTMVLRQGGCRSTFFCRKCT